MDGEKTYSLDEKYIISTSFPYYMIPGELWAKRIKTLALAGFNCVDIYLVWNYHELTENNWDFNGKRDIGVLLKLIAKHGMYAIIHPGPHARLLWDGTGIPPYLLAKMDASERSANNVVYEYLSSWYGKIMPIIAENQYLTDQAEGGKSKKRCSVIKISIEIAKGEFAQLNTSTINKLIQKFDFTIPFDICVVNLNNNSCTVPHSSVAALKMSLAQGYKHLVSENNTSGCCNDFFNTISCRIKDGNRQAALVASTAVINEDAIISPFGKVNELEFDESRLFRRFIEKSSFGEMIYNGKPSGNTVIAVNGENTAPDVIETAVLETPNGGALIACHNKGKEKTNVTVSEKSNNFPQKVPFSIPVIVPAGTCRFILKNFSLGNLGAIINIDYCTAGIAEIKMVGETLHLFLYTDDGCNSKICLNGERIINIKGNLKYFISPESKQITTIIDIEGSLRFEMNSIKIKIVALTYKAAVDVSDIDDKGIINCNSIGNDMYGNRYKEIEFTDKETKITINTEMPDLNYKAISEKSLKYLETNGIYRGFAFYEVSVSNKDIEKTGIYGIVIHKASDICSVYVNDMFVVTKTSFGKNIYAELDSHLRPQKDAYNIRVKTEIWGHSHSDCLDYPAFKPYALKGIGSISVITNRTKISKKCVVIPQKAGSCGIYLCGKTEVTLNDKTFYSDGNGYDYLDITPYVRAKSENEIEIWGETEGSIYFFEGVRGDDYKVANVETGDFALVNGEGQIAVLPFRIAGGENRFLTIRLKNCETLKGSLLKVKFLGSGIKLTAFVNGSESGRVWLGEQGFVFGTSDEIAMTGFAGSENEQFVLYAEGVSKYGGILESIEFVITG